MPGELKKSNILFVYRIKDSDRTAVSSAQSKYVAAGSAKLPLQGLDPIDWCAEMLVKEFLEYFHE